MIKIETKSPHFKPIDYLLDIATSNLAAHILVCSVRVLACTAKNSAALTRLYASFLLLWFTKMPHAFNSLKLHTIENRFDYARNAYICIWILWMQQCLTSASVKANVCFASQHRLFPFNSVQSNWIESFRIVLFSHLWKSFSVDNERVQKYFHKFNNNIGKRPKHNNDA